VRLAEFRYHLPMLRQRLVFGSLLIAFLIGLFWLDDRVGSVSIAGTGLASRFGSDTLPAGVVMAGVFLLLAVLASREVVAMFEAKGTLPGRPVVTGAVIGICLVVYLSPLPAVDTRTWPILATIFAAALFVSLFRYSVPEQHTQGAAVTAAATMFAITYVGILPSFYLLIRHTHSAWIVAGAIFVIKQCDTGAYFTGRVIGKHKLIPWLSPGKTIEGLGGGLVLSAVTAVLLVMWANHLGLFAMGHSGGDAGGSSGGTSGGSSGGMPLWYAGVTGAVIGGVGHAGDLVASLLKRDASVKDSGSLIPGMGGVLDVLDSPLLAAPMVYWMLVSAPT